MVGAKKRLTRAVAVLFAVNTLGACGVRAVAQKARPPEMPSSLGARCKVAASRDNPLVTEWPASEKANLQALIGQGAVVVSYAGCSLRVLPQCRVRGSYRWRRTTISTDTLEIRDADDLFAKLPIGAVSLEGELARSGRLAVRTTISGQHQLADYESRAIAADPQCSGATHVVGAVSVGAFKLQSGGTANSRGAVGAFGVGGRASSSSEESTMREAGSASSCEQATDGAPHMQCASPIQMFLQPLPTSAADRGPPGTVKVKFLPVRPLEQWDVMAGQETKVCTTPCEKWVDPGSLFTFKHDPGWWARNEYIDVPDLRPFAEEERLEVSATPRNLSKLSLGVVATTFGGLAIATGTTLLAVGCSRSDSGMCTAGGITLPLGGLLLAPGIWLIVDSKPEVHIGPMGEPPPAAQSISWR